MKVLCIDHVALAVTDKDAAINHFCELLGAEYIMENQRDDTLYTAVYTAWGETCLTLVHPDDPKCFVQRDIDRKGAGIHHMAIEVEDLDEAEAEFVAKGGKVGPKETIEGVRREFVVSPKNNLGVLLQVLEFFPPYKGMKPSDRYKKLAADGKLIKA